MPKGVSLGTEIVIFKRHCKLSGRHYNRTNWRSEMLQKILTKSNGNDRYEQKIAILNG